MGNKQLSKNPVMEREQQPEILKSILDWASKKQKNTKKKIKNFIAFQTRL